MESQARNVKFCTNTGHVGSYKLYPITTNMAAMMPYEVTSFRRQNQLVCVNNRFSTRTNNITNTTIIINNNNDSNIRI
jgi:hypothetical protein